MRGDLPASVRPSACPSCGATLAAELEDLLRCPADGTTYPRQAGIWRALDPASRSAADRFLAQYRVVRRAEGWGADDEAYYRALPCEDRSGRHVEIWRLRAVTYRAFVRHVLPAAATERPRLTILDLGAGNGWLSFRLARMGHEVAAVDLNDDDEDGLGAHTRYGAPATFSAVQASFDRLPWPDDFADMIVYNGSLHYSGDYRATLGEARRVLRPAGRIVVLDSPFYRQPDSGATMMRERAAAFRSTYGCRPEEIAAEGFLTLARLHALGEALGIRWRIVTPYYGLRWALLPLVNRMRGRREPARFHLVIGQVDDRL